MLFEGWLGFPLNENIQAAKIFMQKRFAQFKNKSFSDLSQEELKQAIENENYKKIIQLTQKNSGYALPFLKFHFNQKVPIRNLQQLQDWLVKNPSLISRFPMSVEKYSSMENQGEITGFEALNDAIRTLERNMEARWLVDRLPSKLKNEYRALPEEKQTEFLNLAHSLKELDGDDPNKSITKRLLDKIKAMESDDMESVIKYCSDYINGYQNLDLKKKMEDIANLSPGAGILYFKYPYLAISVRNEETQKKLFKIANWCINRGNWKDYAGKKGLQINIFNYSLPPNDPMFLTGTTVYYDGRIRASHDLNDGQLLKGNGANDIKTHLLNLGYPKELSTSIGDSLAEEIKIKSTLERLLSSISDGTKIGLNRKEMILSELFGVASDSLRGDYKEKAWEEIVLVVTKILNSSKVITLDGILDFFMEYGILSEAALRVYESFLKGSITSDERKKVYQASESIFDELEKYYNMGFRKQENTRMDSILKSKSNILSKVSS